MLSLSTVIRTRLGKGLGDDVTVHLQRRLR